MKMCLIAAATVAATLCGGVASAQVHVGGYYKNNGTYVQPYVRTAPDSNPRNNYGYPGNYNPNSGGYSTGSPDAYERNNGNGYGSFGGGYGGHRNSLGGFDD